MALAGWRSLSFRLRRSSQVNISYCSLEFARAAQWLCYSQSVLTGAETVAAGSRSMAATAHSKAFPTESFPLIASMASGAAVRRPEAAGSSHCIFHEIILLLSGSLREA